MPGKDCSLGALPDKPVSGPMVPYRVFVASLPCDIAVYSTLESDSVAVGKYRGKRVDAWTRAARALSSRLKLPDAG